MERVSVPPRGRASLRVMRYTRRGPGTKVWYPSAQEPEVYMPALPASAEETTGKVPLVPDCTATTFTGARHSGCVGVGVGVELKERVAELLGVPVPV